MSRYEVHFGLSTATSQSLALAQARAALGLPPEATNDEVVAAAQAFRDVLEAIAAGQGGQVEAAAVLASV